MSATRKNPPGSIGAKLVVWSIAALGLFAVTYLAWLRLAVALWHWANAVWWHWAVAIVVFVPLLLLPGAFILLGRRLIAAAGSDTRAHLRWATVSYLGALALVVLILWAFAATPEWWAPWHWWLWGVAVIGAAALNATGRLLRTVYERRPKAPPSAAGKKPPGLTAELIVWSVAALGFFLVAYLAWLDLPVALWHWANAVWWHWAVAIVGFVVLVVFPAVFVLMAGSHLIAAAGPDARAPLRWETVSYLGALALIVLILWAFAATPEWWAPWHWWLWGVAVIGAAAVSAGGRMLCTVYEVGKKKKVRPGYAAEWKFNHGDVNSPPALGIAMSGGGIRSAAFNLGVLHALHGNGLLRNVDVMSAVSGGTYAMSWYLLQPFYAAKAAEREHKDFRLDDTIDEMFRPDGRFQKRLSWNPSVMDRSAMVFNALMDLTWWQWLRTMAAAWGNPGYYNAAGSGRGEYRKKLQRLFQGLPSPDSDWAIANGLDEPTSTELTVDQSRFSDVMPVSYRELAEFAQQHRLPYFIFNATVLVQQGYRHMLWPTAFELTAHDLGSDVCGYSTWEELKTWDVTEHIGEGMSQQQWMDHLRKQPGSRDRRQRRWVVMVNLAPAISGAAIGLSYFDPKKRSREMRLKTWTPFVSNSDLGYLLYRELWNEPGTLYLSDGGHCENLGAYALIKRQCQKIIIVDAEHEAHIPYIFDGYSKLKERLAKEMELALRVPDIDAYLESAEGGSKPLGPGPAVMTGDVTPMTPDGPYRPMLSVIYVKLGLDRYHLGDYPQAVSEYARKHAHFPQDPTTHQSYTTEQFVAYRELGRHVARDLDKTLAAMP